MSQIIKQPRLARQLADTSGTRIEAGSTTFSLLRPGFQADKITSSALAVENSAKLATGKGIRNAVTDETGRDELASAFKPGEYTHVINPGVPVGRAVLFGKNEDGRLHTKIGTPSDPAQVVLLEIPNATAQKSAKGNAELADSLRV
jgi:hypothetical protein